MVKQYDHPSILTKHQGPVYSKSSIDWTVYYNSAEDRSWYVCRTTMVYKKSWLKSHPTINVDSEVFINTFHTKPDTTKLLNAAFDAFLAGARAAR